MLRASCLTLAVTRSRTQDTWLERLVLWYMQPRAIEMKILSYGIVWVLCVTSLTCLCHKAVYFLAVCGNEAATLTPFGS